MTACKWRTPTLGNTAPTPAQEFGDTRSFVLSFVCKATSGYGLRTRRVLKGFVKDKIKLETIDPKAAPDGGSRALCPTDWLWTGM